MLRLRLGGCSRQRILPHQLGNRDLDSRPGLRPRLQVGNRCLQGFDLRLGICRRQIVLPLKLMAATRAESVVDRGSTHDLNTGQGEWAGVLPPPETLKPVGDPPP